MSSTPRFSTQAVVAGGARPCALLGHGTSIVALAMPAHDATRDWAPKQDTAKRPTRRLDRHLT